MAVRPGKKREDRPLLKSEFDRFEKTRFTPLVQDVAALKTDVAAHKTDVAGLKTDVAGLKTDVAALKTDVAGLKIDVATLKVDMSMVRRDVRDLSSIMQKQHREVMTGLDEMVTLFKGSHDKLIVHDVRIAELETRVAGLENP